MSEKEKSIFIKLRSRKNVLVITALFLFLGSIVYMQLGNSVHTRFDQSEGPVQLESDPQSFVLPNANNANLTGGFNTSDGFFDLPGLNIPPSLASQFPSTFGNGTFGDLPSIGNPGSGIDPPLGGGNPIDVPTIDPPSPPGSGLDPPSGGGGPGTGDGAFQPPDLNQDNPNQNDGGNGLGNQTDKARNLPKLDFFNFGSINLDFIDLSNIVPKDNALIGYIFILLSGLFFNGNFIPLFFRRLEEFEQSGVAGDSLFFVPKRNLEELRKRKERIKRLMVFKDHVDELIDRSKVRIIEETVSTTIIVGYHELDEAFSEFANLIRTKDITPLEHANQHFDEDEINNEVLEKIVELFYLTRYGRRDLEEKYGDMFIELLQNLVVANPEFMSHINELDELINSQG